MMCRKRSDFLPQMGSPLLERQSRGQLIDATVRLSFLFMIICPMSSSSRQSSHLIPCFVMASSRQETGLSTARNV